MNKGCGRAGPRKLKQIVQLGEPASDADLALLDPDEIFARLRLDGLPCLGRDPFLVNQFDQLLESKHNQNAKHDNADLVKQGALAVQWFRQMNMHKTSLESGQYF